MTGSRCVSCLPSPLLPCCLRLSASCPAVLPVSPGRAVGWRPWAALPVLLALCWVVYALLQKGNGGLGEAALTTLGPVLGRAVVGFYLLWGLFLLAANARLVALRFLTVSYRNAPLPLFLVALLALTLWLGVKPVRVLARAGEVFYLALVIGLGLSLAMGAFQMDPGRILPLWGRICPKLEPRRCRCWACWVTAFLPPSWAAMWSGVREGGGRPCGGL